MPEREYSYRDLSEILGSVRRRDEERREREQGFRRAEQLRQERTGISDPEYRVNGDYIAERIPPPPSSMRWAHGRAHLEFQYSTGGYLPPPAVNTSTSTSAVTIDTGSVERDDGMPVVTDHAVLDRITADLRERHQQVVTGLNEALRNARSVIDHLEQARQYLTEDGDLVVSTLNAERAKYSARAARDMISACGRQVTSIPSRLTTVTRIAADAENERQRIERERASAILAENIDALRAAHPGEYIPVAGDEIRVPGLSDRTLTVRLLREGSNDERVSFVLDDLTDGNVYTRSLSALRTLGMVRASEYVRHEPELPGPEEATPRRGDTVIMPHGISGRQSEPSRTYEVLNITQSTEGTLVTLERNGMHWTRALNLLRTRGLVLHREPGNLVQVERLFSLADLETGDRFLLRDAMRLDEELHGSTVFTVQDSMPWTGDGELRFTDSHYHTSFEIPLPELEDYGLIALAGDWLPVEGEVVTFDDAPHARYVINELTATARGSEPILSFHLEGAEYVYRVDLSSAATMGIRLLSQ